ncbi:MAG: hypothetical protein ABS939_00310 [Psychrobacillus sp.]
MSKKREIKGKRMFQRGIDYINLYHFDDPTPHKYEFTAASLSAYILLHFHCDDFGRYLEKDFVLKDLTDKYNLPYSSIHKGMALLFDLDMLSYVEIKGNTYIQLSFYDNQPDENGRMNYFILPTLVLQSDFLNASIKSRDVNGILMMLDQMNSLYREQSINGGGPCERTFENWIRCKKKTTRNIKNWFSHLKQLVKVVKEEGASIRKKIVKLTFSERVYEEREVKKEKEITIAKIRKSVNHAFVQANLQYSYDQVLDCTRVLRHELIEPLFDAVELYTHHKRALELMAQDIINNVMLNIQAAPEPIVSIGGYFRTKCRTLMKKMYPLLNPDFRAEVKAYYITHQKPFPSYVND